MLYKNLNLRICKIILFVIKILYNEMPILQIRYYANY